MSYEDDMSRWSNRKKADTFLQLLTHTVARLGGEVRVPLDELKSFAPDIGFAVEDGHVLIAVDMDGFDAPKQLLHAHRTTAAPDVLQVFTPKRRFVGTAVLREDDG